MKIDWRPMRRLFLSIYFIFAAMPFYRKDWPGWVMCLGLVCTYVMVWMNEDASELDKT